jgi:hypothetical protein
MYDLVRNCSRLRMHALWTNWLHEFKIKRAFLPARPNRLTPSRTLSVLRQRWWAPWTRLSYVLGLPSFYSQIAKSTRTFWVVRWSEMQFQKTKMPTKIALSRSKKHRTPVKETPNSTNTQNYSKFKNNNLTWCK